MMKLVKVTEVVGQHEAGENWIIDPEEDVYARLDGMIPEGATNARGRWRITVEFEPNDEAAANEDRR